MAKGGQLEQMRRYDPQVIAAYYRWRPWRVVGRLLQVGWAILSFLLALGWDFATGREERQRPQRAAQLRRLITELGPTFIKVGQALSTRPDLVRRDYLEELTILQDQLPSFSNGVAHRLIEQELGQPVQELYREFSPQPVAAASLGQVYRGRLPSGEEVAVKVQRPGLVPQLTLDLYILRGVAHTVQPWLPIHMQDDLSLIVDEFGRKLFEEIDYLNEACNAEKFADNFRNDPTVKVPKIYWPLSSRRVLTLEWINGYKLTDAAAVQKAGIAMHQFVQIGVRAGLKQLLEFGFFHADPHPGNLFLTTEGQLAYIDFGMMDQLTQQAKEHLVDALVHLVNKDYRELAQDFIRLGFLPPGTDIDPIVPALELLWQEAVGSQLREFRFKQATDEFSDLMYRYPFRVPAHFALIIRSLVTQEGIAMNLDANFKIVDAAYPYVAQRLLMGETPEFRQRLLEVLFKDSRFQWQRLESLLSVTQGADGIDLQPVLGPALSYLFSDEGQFLRQQLILALTEDDRLHFAEVGRLWQLVQAQIRPRALLELAWNRG
ncbi:Putative unusual protein kinase [Gloeomargarita lithophora Alchichica-D10]|uniref:Unusual protein kinase n=1 Tax=Gloeomargarita lithophora Alchichica-D10 TaxID=1188229 RepID=A0A1J0ADW0_9CYAN|nr:AarF/ABC1/UbiB kinase family protein [Gloeomargarita lithophora]APB34104.1 Putative unusual protein kinase [Gloeomargarita lithophora Alchichica-D10]